MESENGSDGSFSTKLFYYIEKEDLNKLSHHLESFVESTSESEVVNSPNILNSDFNFESALHSSVWRLNFDLVQILLQYGANPSLLDSKQQTPALLVVKRVKECRCDCCSRKAVRCINLLGDYHADFGISDKFENFPLLEAAESQSVECATALLRNGAPLDFQVRRRKCAHTKSTQNQSMLKILSEKLPSIVLDVFDRAITTKGNHSIHDPECEVAIDLSIILPTKVMETYRNGLQNSQINQVHPAQNSESSITITNGKSIGETISENIKDFESNSANETEGYKPRKEMGYLSDLIESRHSDLKAHKAILRHPLVTVFTDVKWRSLELIFIFYIAMQVLVLIAYTTFLFITIFLDCPYDLYQHIRGVNSVSVGTENVNLKFSAKFPTAEKLCEIRLASKVISGYVLFCTLAVLVKEIQHIIMDFKEYVTDILNYVQLFGLGSIILTIVIAWDPFSPIYDWLYPVASFGIGIAWCQIFIQIGRFPTLAIYIDMFAKIAVNFCWSLFIYSFILVGFAMSYCILFPSKPELVDVPLAFVRVLTMMIGEMDYEGLFASKPEDSSHDSVVTFANGTSNSNRFGVAHPKAAHVWYVCFLIMVTLVLMNLLVGLAVSDIQGCKNHAEIVVMKRRIRYTCYLEKSFYLLTHFLPTFFKDYLRKKIAIIKPANEKTFFCFQFHKIPLDNCRMIVKPNSSEVGMLSEESKHALKQWLLNKENQHRTQQKCKFIKKSVHSRAVRDNLTESAIEHQNFNVNDLKNSEMPFLIKSQELNFNRIEKKLADLENKLELLLESRFFERSDSTTE